MNIYVPIEVKVRELEGKTLLALAAAERGHTVILGGKEDTLGLARRGLLKPGILHEKSLTPSAAKLESLRALREHRHVVTSQDEESGLLDVSYERFAQLRYSAETCAMVSRILCWGSHDARTVSQLYGRPGQTTIVETGSPRVDLWRREFTEYYSKSRVPVADGAGDYVLVSSNLGRVLNLKRFWEQIGRLREKFRRRAHPLIDEEYEYAAYRETSWQMRLLEEYIRMIRALASADPKITVVVRPHPVEVVDAWRMLIGDRPNVVVTRDGSLSAWIRGAKAVIHNGCTSGLEAAVCGVPRIAYMPIRSEFERTVPNSVSYQAGSFEALREAVETILGGGNLDLEPDKKAEEVAVLRDRFANLDGPLAADRIVDQWEQLAASSLEKPNDWGSVRRTVLGRRLRAGISRSLSSVGYRRLRRRPESGRLPSLTGHKYPALGDGEMDAIIGRLKSSLGRFGGVVHQRLGERSFILRPS